MRLFDYLAKGAERWPNRLGFVGGDTRYSYAEALAYCRRIASALLAMGLPEGARVGLYSPNDPDGFLCLLAIAAANLVAVPVNAKNAIEENIAFLATTECSLLFYHSSFAGQINEIRGAVPSLQQLICIDQANGETPSLAQAIADQNDDLPDFSDDPYRLVTILSSGGTTGRPKGGMWTNLTWETMVATFWSAMPDDRPAVHLVAAPMTHAAGVLCFPLLARGATMVFIERADPLSVMQAIQTHRVTHLFLPPTVIYMMLSHPRLREFDYSSLRYFLYAAAPMSAEKLAEALECFGSVMVQSYGQLEAPMFCTFFSAEEHVEALEQGKTHRLKSAGRPTLLTRIAIMDDDGHLLPHNERGEIVVRGNLVMPGYYQNPQATAEIRQHGWHHTGDVGYLDEDGFLYIVDRKKDMIITGGFNVYSTEVEQVILSHPDVQDCVVIGIPDEKWGEAVKAIIERKPGGQVTPEELISLCKAKIGSVKAPKSIEIWDHLPRSAVGKVLKRTVRDQFWADRDRMV